MVTRTLLPWNKPFFASCRVERQVLSTSPLTTEAKVERAVKPESIALAMFGLIAAFAALGIALSVIARQLRSTDEERQVLRAMGASPAAALADALLGIVVAIAAGSLVACAIAVALSPLSPLGPIRSVYHPGIAFDWTVLGGGLLWLVGGLVLGAAVLALRAAPHRLARRRRVLRRHARRGLPRLPRPWVCPCRGSLACSSPSNQELGAPPCRPDGSWRERSSPSLW